jgi:hypothetical protein
MATRRQAMAGLVNTLEQWTGPFILHGFLRDGRVSAEVVIDSTLDGQTPT